MAGAALAAGRGALVNDYPSSPGAMAEFIPFTSRLLAAPLMAGDRPLGVMTAGRGPGAPPFTEEDLSTLTDFATQAAVALEHARLFDEATRNAAQYQALLEVSGAVSSTLDVDRVLDLVLERCQALLGVAAVGVMRIDRETGVVAYERGPRPVERVHRLAAHAPGGGHHRPRDRGARPGVERGRAERRGAWRSVRRRAR